MTALAVEQMTKLASALEAESPGLRADLTDFTSGGAMLDVRAADGRMFVMAYGPSFGFGIDEVHEGDGWQSDYRFSTTDFAKAETQLRQLVRDEDGTQTSAIGLNLLVIYARDVETSKAFYERLGLQFVAEQHGNGPRHYAATMNGTVFEIYPCTGGQERGSVRVGFTVPSLDRVVEDLRTHGNRIISEPKASPWGRRAVLADPDGVRVELMELSSPHPPSKNETI